MGKIETVTISLPSEMMDEIRKLSVRDFRSISKQITYLLSISLNQEKKLV
jgi:hypothetical protein